MLSFLDVLNYFEKQKLQWNSKFMFSLILSNVTKQIVDMRLFLE